MQSPKPSILLDKPVWIDWVCGIFFLATVALAATLGLIVGLGAPVPAAILLPALALSLVIAGVTEGPDKTESLFVVSCWMVAFFLVACIVGLVINLAS